MTSAYPYEAWRYRHISGIGYDIRFDFVDSSRRGEYRLAGVRDAIGQAALKSRLPGFEGMASEASEQFLKVNSDRTVSIYLPEDWAGDRVGVRGFIVDHAGRSVYSFEETTARTWLTPPLSPGSYLVSIVVTKAGDVQQQVELGFNVE